MKNLGKVFWKVSLMLFLSFFTMLGNADKWYQPTDGGGWFHSQQGACERHAARWRGIFDPARYEISCAGLRVDGFGTVSYIISSSRRDGSPNGGGSFQYVPEVRQCEPGLMPRVSGPGCTPSPENGGSPDLCAGNPINPLVGNNYQEVVDSNFVAASPIKLSRFYNSQFQNFQLQESLGLNWKHSYSHRIIASSELQGVESAEVLRPNGKAVYFKKETGEWIGGGELNLSKIVNADGDVQNWLVKQGQFIETYDVKGRIVEIENTKTNRTISLKYYNPPNFELYDGFLETVEDEYGNSLVFNYNDVGLVDSVFASNGEVYQYIYDDNNVLTEVSYSDQTSDIYYYDSPHDSRLLTGISDRSGRLYVEWEYDSSMRAITSQHFAGPNSVVDKTSIDYAFINDANTPNVTVTSPLGKQTSYYYVTVNGVRRVSFVEGHQSENCAAANKNYTYYPSGLLKTKTDWKNNITSYQYNARNLESSRTEALGTPQERTITTEWHPTFNLRTKITEPGKETIFSYDAEGRLLSQSSNELPPN